MCKLCGIIFGNVCGNIRGWNEFSGVASEEIVAVEGEYVDMSNMFTLPGCKAGDVVRGIFEADCGIEAIFVHWLKGDEPTMPMVALRPDCVYGACPCKPCEVDGGGGGGAAAVRDTGERCCSCIPNDRAGKLYICNEALSCIRLRTPLAAFLSCVSRT